MRGGNERADALEPHADETSSIGAARAVRGRGSADRLVPPLGHTDALEDGSPEIRVSSVALFRIDVINPMDFDDAERLLPAAITAAERITRLKRRASASGVPTVYVNGRVAPWPISSTFLVTTRQATC